MTGPVRVKVAALGAAYAAMTGEIEADELKPLGILARRELPEGDYLRSAIEAFVADARAVLRLPDERPELGRRLLHALRVDLTPAVPGSERADVNG